MLKILKKKKLLSSRVVNWYLRARFTNSLHQHKPSFGMKIVLSGFTKDAQWKISTEKAWTQLFLCLTLLNMHVSLSDTKFMGGKY